MSDWFWNEELSTKLVKEVYKLEEKFGIILSKKEQMVIAAYYDIPLECVYIWPEKFNEKWPTRSWNW